MKTFKKIFSSVFKRAGKRLKLIAKYVFTALRHPILTIRWLWLAKKRQIISVAALVLIVLVPIYIVFFAKSTEAAWWNDMWQYRKKITIDHDQVAGELQNFPVLVSLTDTDLAANAQSDGDDIAFTDGDGNKFSHEIESYTSATGVLVAWVKIPNLTPSHDMDIYMYYGNSTCQTQQAPTDVWDENFKMVQHMNQDPSGGATPDGSAEMLDSTENNNDGNSSGTMTSGDLVDAKVGKGLDFDGGDDHLQISDSGSIRIADDSFTVSLWVKPNSTLNANTDIIGNETTVGSQQGWTLRQNNTNFRVMASVHDGVNDAMTTGGVDATVPADIWTLITMTVNKADNTLKFWVNGMAVYSTDITGFGSFEKNIGFRIGEAEGSGRQFRGQIDSLHASDIARSSQWMLTEYNNQNDPNAFLSVNSQQQERPGLPIGFWPFNEGHGTITHDESGAGNGGTITGATWQQESECVSGKCLKFDGSGDEVDVGDVSY